MNAADPIQTRIVVSNANAGVAASTSVQDILNNPALLALLTQLLGPFVRQFGHSSAVGAFSGLIVWAFTHYGLALSPELAEAMCVGAMVICSYAWQSWSIWAGKKNAPVQPTIPTP